MTIKSYRSDPLFNVMLFSLFWALQIFSAKLGFNLGAFAIPFQAALFISAILTVAILLFPKSGSDLLFLFKTNPKLFWTIFFANAIQSGLGTCLSIIGISMTEAINAGFLMKLSTITTIVFAWLLINEKITRLKILVILVALTGAYLLTTKGQVLLPQVGDLFILGACVCWSLGNVIIRKALKTHHINPDVVTMQKPIAGFPVLLVLIAISISFSGSMGDLSQALSCCSFSPNLIPYAFTSGFLLAMAWIFLYRTLEVATASYMTLMSMATPIFVSILAVIFLNETLVWIQMIGAGMIILSGVLVSKSDISRS